MTFQALSEEISLTFRKSVVRTCFVLCGVLTLIELCCYLSYFQFIYNHDNKVAARIVLLDTLRIRNRTTAISMVGQILSWFMQVWYTVLVGVLSTMFKVDLLREISVLVKISQYFYIPLLQIFTSTHIKNFIRREGILQWKMRQK